VTFHNVIALYGVIPTPIQEHYLLTPCTVNSELPSTSRERVNSVQTEVFFLMARCTNSPQQCVQNV